MKDTYLTIILHQMVVEGEHFPPNHSLSITPNYLINTSHLRAKATNPEKRIHMDGSRLSHIAQTTKLFIPSLTTTMSNYTIISSCLSSMNGIPISTTMVPNAISLPSNALPCNGLEFLLVEN